MDAIPAIMSLVRRSSDCTDEGCAELPTSQWQKTGIPVIISVVLFILVFVVLFLIVRKKRQSVARAESEAQRKIDLDDVEDRAAFTATRKK